MIRSLRLVALSVALPIIAAACWLEVPNLHNTEGGYPPDLAATSGTEPDHEASPAAASETSAGTPGAEAPPGSDRESS